MMGMKMVMSRPFARWSAAMLILAGVSITAIPAAGQEPTAQDAMDQALAFAQCMRDNGYPEFPDPDPEGGGVRLMMGVAGGESGARFRAAQEACRDLSPAGLAAGARNDPQRIEELLAFAECMRRNGVPEWPDPNADGAFEFESGFIGNRNDRRTRAAMETCRETQGPAGGIMVTRGGR